MISVQCFKCQCKEIEILYVMQIFLNILIVDLSAEAIFPFLSIIHATAWFSLQFQRLSQAFQLLQSIGHVQIWVARCFFLELNEST